MPHRVISLPRLLLLALLLIGAPALADTLPVPALSGRVVDQAGILNSAEEGRLTTKLKNLEDNASIQLVVVTLPSLRGTPIEDWGLTLGRTWGIGQKGKDNGVLLIVAPNDRELRIEVGYGLEGTLPDATANAIIRNVIVPRFKGGDMADGISDGVDAIVAVLSGSGEKFTSSREDPGSRMLMPLLVMGFIMTMWIVMQISQGRRRRGSRYYRNSGGGWLYVDDDDRGSSGGFSSGRSGGGFSGGGGSFGGGGSSGRW
jgi:uncharacterized protein